MAQNHGTFFTSIGCMDGRVQKVISDFGCQKFHAEFPDTITEAGLVGLLTKSKAGDSLYESIKEKLLISLEKHNSLGIIVHGHEECAGNPVDKIAHEKDIKKSLEIISKMIDGKVPVIAVFVAVNPKPQIEVI